MVDSWAVWTVVYWVDCLVGTTAASMVVSMVAATVVWTVARMAAW